MPFTTQINIHADSQNINHTLEIIAGDRPGLLAKIAFIFLQLGIDLHNAKINTLGNRAEDSFLISDKHQQALNAAQIDALLDNLSSL
jgi:[protein-PII] uridylyltransferase